MGKKGSWFYALKRIFACNSRKKLTHGSAKKNAKEKKKARRILRHGEFKSFLFREPSSIEKILGEVDDQKLLVRPPASEQSGIPSAFPVKPTSPRISSPRAASPRSSYTAASPSATSPRIPSLRVASSSVISPRAASPKATSHRAASPKATSPRAASPKATSPRAASPKATSHRAASPNATSLRAASPKAISPRAASPKSLSPRAASLKAISPRATYPEVSEKHKEISYANKPEPTLTLHLAATKIQAAYRRHVGRRSFKSLRGLARLQGVVRNRNAKRQTVNAMKQMQLLVRVQMQIQSRRTQMFQALQSQAYTNDKEAESTLSKWTKLTEAGNHDDWDNSVLTKEEVEARRREKVEAVIKRERAMTYAYSHQLWKSNPKSIVDIRASGIPWWWNWLDNQLPPGNDSESQSAVKDVHLTPPRTISEHKPSPWRLSHNFRHLHLDNDSHESVTPRSTKSAVPLRGKLMHTPRRTSSPMSSTSISNYSRRRASAANSPFSHSFKDDDSLTSCPPFSGPSYMSPTLSARAKFRGKSIPEERNAGTTPSNSSRRRLSFPLTPRSGKDATSLRDHDPTGDHMSVGSTASTSSVVGRKPFNRFV
ncbi:protein IQ-DOMAIN 13 [Nicotiana tabacum]|uniref:Protein IQ-DOMAIN 13 n=2 Tax=Nicotiana tabacum TaxID=4097 RepID=A0AC58TUS7_TOBAC|nr:PREDICTED: protein IQ-DOMAIN 14-like [Nicotiana tabacum]